MGKASRKKQASSQADRQQADKLESEQTGKLTGLKANRQTSRQADKLVSRQAVHLIIILVIGFLAYSNTFQSPFQWDESDYIVGNPIVKDLGFFAEPSRAEGLPVVNGLMSRYIGYLTFALNYKLNGLNVFGYHLVNLAIHLINAILVYFLVLLTFRTPYFSNQRSAVSSQRAEGTPLNPPLARGESKGGAVDLSPFTIHYSRLFALAVALLFVAHPVQTEAVTYVFQRFASLVSLFYLLSLVLYIKGRIRQAEAKVKNEMKTKKHKELSSAYTFTCFFLSFISAVLAMKTKENAFTLPVIITLYEFLFFSGPLKARVLRLVPFLLTMLIIPMTIMGLESTAGEVISEIRDPGSLGYEELSGSEYLFTQIRVIITYIRLLLLPVNQNLVYDYPVYRSFFTPPVLFSFLFLAALFGAAVWLVYKSRQGARGKGQGEISDQQSAISSQPVEDTPLNPPLSRGEVKRGVFHASRFTLHLSRLIAFGVLWFFITLSVESSVIPIPMVMDEYRLYLPSVGFFIAIMSGATLLVTRFSQKAPLPSGIEGQLQTTFHLSGFTKIAAALFSVIVLALASATYARNALWKDKVSLWEDVVRKSPSSARAYNNLGLAFNEKGLREKAIGMYDRAIALNPRFALAYSNLGVAYARTGRAGMAIENFQKAVSLDPKDVVAYENMARTYGETGQLEKAAENYSRAIALKPYDSAAYQGLGTAYVMMGRLDDALAAYTRFVILSPSDPEAYRSRGIVYAKKGDPRSAREDFEKACSLGSGESCGYLKNGRF